jgi:hypothetical protein
LNCNICHSSYCLQKDFKLLHHLSDSVLGDDLHYKSFEELYGIQTTENHRPSFVNTKVKTKKSGIKTIKTKYIMPFCSSAIRAKNVGITVNCVECDKPRLLFSAKKLTEKDRTTLREFLDTIFYTCGMPFHNTCDLATAVPPKRPDDDLENEADDHEIIDEVDDSNKNEQDEDLDGTIEPEDSDNEKEDSEEEEHEKRRILFVKYFQESLLMTRGPVHHKLKNLTIQLEFIQTFALNVEIWTLQE